MTRVRHYRRPDRRRNRQRNPPPKAGFLIRELAQYSGVTAATIRTYVQRGLLARVKFYGTATRYPRDHLLRILATQYLRARGFKHLDDVRRKLDSWSPAEMERWLLQFPLHQAALAALGHGAKSTAAPPAEATPSSPPQVNSQVSTEASSSPSTNEKLAPTATVPHESWRRVVLLPGLELHLKDDAAPIAARLAQRLLATYAELVDGK